MWKIKFHKWVHKHIPYTFGGGPDCGHRFPLKLAIILIHCSAHWTCLCMCCAMLHCIVLVCFSARPDWPYGRGSWNKILKWKLFIWIFISFCARARSEKKNIFTNIHKSSPSIMQYMSRQRAKHTCTHTDIWPRKEIQQNDHQYILTNEAMNFCFFSFWKFSVCAEWKLGYKPQRKHLKQKPHK